MGTCRHLCRESGATDRVVHSVKHRGRCATDHALLADEPNVHIVNTKAVTTIKRLIRSVALCALATSAWGQGGALDGGRPLDLSVPAQSLPRAWGSAPSVDATRLPGLGELSSRPGGSVGLGRSAGHRSDLPYGAGYEARRGQGGAGGGRGMGRRH